jgi:macrolide-specific efflux system membrane fusion protein
VQVNLQVAQATKALTIPMAALGDKAVDGRYTVQVPGADGKPQPRQVKVGISEAAKVQVLDGLKAGDKVLLAPAAAASGPTP